MKPKTLFYCTECGNETPKWAGKCPACGAWNTIVEQPAGRPGGREGRPPARQEAGRVRRARPVTELEADDGNPVLRLAWESWTGSWAAVPSRARWCWWAARRESASPR